MFTPPRVELSSDMSAVLFSKTIICMAACTCLKCIYSTHNVMQWNQGSVSINKWNNALVPHFEHELSCCFLPDVLMRMTLVLLNCPHNINMKGIF